jgi:hypothetical protein
MAFRGRICDESRHYRQFSIAGPVASQKKSGEILDFAAFL